CTSANALDDPPPQVMVSVPKPGTDSTGLVESGEVGMKNPNERDWPPPWTNWLAASPPSRLALRPATRVDELTLNGALPLATFRFRAVPAPEFVRASMEFLVEPVRLDVAFTLLVLPRLKTAPTPEPDAAPVMAITAAAVPTPMRTDLT